METKSTNETLNEMVKAGANNPAANAVNVNVTIDGQRVAGLVTNSGITGEALVAAGLAVQTAKKAYDVHRAAENARKQWTGKNEWAKQASDGLVVCLEVVGKATGEIQRANRKIALALALADETGEALRLTSPNGKPFESTKALFHCLYPNLSENTIGQYLGVGREIYLRSIRGELTGSLARLNELEPGTALSAVSALKEAPEKLEKELAKIGTGKITQSKLKEAAKAAKAPETAKTVKKEDGTKGTARKDASAQDEIARLAKRNEYMEPLFGKYGAFKSDKTDKAEWIFYIAAEDRTKIRDVLDKAIKAGDAQICLECLRDWLTT